MLKKNTACSFAVAPLYVNLCHISLNTAPNCPAKNEGDYGMASLMIIGTVPLYNVMAVVVLA